jgi:ATP-dependent Clp protease ATP-binding subunit ClpA
MSEFKEEHAVAGLYGAPPGYVGYEEGGLLINKIRQHPYAVVLFDEIEKAHPAVFDLFLQMMDEGRLHDKLGKEGDFSNALIIFTSNCESQYIAGEFAKGHVPAVSTLLEKMAQRFRPEFLGRLTEIIPFAPLTRPMVQNILRIQLKNVHQALQKQGIQLVVSADALDVLAQRGFSPTYGARPLAGVIRSEVRRPLSRSIISGAVKAGDRVELVAGNEGRLEWQVFDPSGSEK